MFTAIALTLALSVDQVPLPTLEKYYWDCDAMFMKDELGGQDMLSCLEVTDQFILRRFNNDKDKFREYWRENRIREWRKRGFNKTHKS